MSEQQSFLKRHGFVIAGVSLPILVIVSYAVARLVPRFLVAAPLYDLVYLSASNFSNTPRDRSCQIEALDGKVYVRWSFLEQAAYEPKLRAFRFGSRNGEALELEIPEAGDPEAQSGAQEQLLGGLEGVRVSTSSRAPDGYEFIQSYGRSSGLVGELFFSGSSGQRSTIRKNGRVIALPRSDTEDYGYEQITFLGWAIPEEAAR